LTWQSGHRGDSQGVFLVAQIFPYGHYGMFASLPLRPNSYGRRHAKLANFLEGLAFRASSFLTAEETRIFRKMNGTIRVVSNKKIDSDLRDIRREGRRGNKILKSHALALIKAIDFWKSCFNAKYLEWRESCEISQTGNGFDIRDMLEQIQPLEGE
jgi:hypothetical protein